MLLLTNIVEQSKYMEKVLTEFDRLIKIMDKLRAECPWDQKQTFESLRSLTMEEVYELSDAISNEQWKEVGKELGDVLLHIVFYAKMGSEKGYFKLEEVIADLCEKLIFRHPHIYGDTAVSGEGEVKSNWEKIKLKEGKKSVLEGVPNSLPSLIKAYRIQDKASGVGFDWPNEDMVWDKVKEEILEFEQESKNKSEKMEDEFGDILFALVNYARKTGINPDDALSRTNQKFIERFQYIEESAKKQNKVLQNMTLDEMEVYWREAKEVKKKAGD